MPETPRHQTTADEPTTRPALAPVSPSRRLLLFLAAGSVGGAAVATLLGRLTAAESNHGAGGGDDDDDRDDDEHRNGDDRDDDCGGHDYVHDNDDGRDDRDDDDEPDEDELLTQAVVPAGSLVINIFDDDDFSPPTLTIDTGQMVTFVNYDGDDHTATGSAFDTGIIPQGGNSASVVLDTPGRFPYSCLIHPEMVGEIQVRDAAGNVPERATAGAAAPADAVPVQIVNLAFAPASLSVPAGGTVAWTNDDSLPHTATALDGSFDSGILDPGGAFSWTFATPGTIAYQCDLHPEMQGEVVVTGEGPITAAQRAEATPAATPTSASTPPADIPAGGASVAIVDLAFEPPTITVAVGTEVIWTNTGQVPHTVTADDFDSGVLDGDQEFRHTFPEAGTFAYLCAIHPAMTGQVQVEAP